MAITSTLNITLIGDLAVGKDNLVHTLIGPTESYQSIVTETISNCKVNLNTLSGTPSSIKSLPVDLKGSNVILVCYDASSQASYDNACKIWLKEAIKYSLTPHCQADIILVGLQSSNKKNVVDKETADKFAEEKGIEHLVVESANSEKVRKFFANIVNQHPVIEVENIFKKQDENELNEQKNKKIQARKNNQAIIIKIALGTVLASGIITACVFLWPVVVASAAIVAAAATVSALTTAYLGVAITAAVFTASIFATAFAGLTALGGWLISKVTDAFRKTPSIFPQVDGFADLKSDLLYEDKNAEQAPVFISTYASVANSPLAPSYGQEAQENTVAINADALPKLEKKEINALIADLKDENSSAEFNGKSDAQIITDAMEIIKKEESDERRLISTK